jgi:hypothetical protein
MLFPRQRLNPPRERWAEICYFHPTFETEKRTCSTRLLCAIKLTTTSPGFALRSCSERLCRFQSWCANTYRRALSRVVPLQVRGLIAVRLAHAIPSQAGTLLRQERRTRGSNRCFPVHAIEVSLKCLHSTLPHSSASRLRPALSSRQ